MKFGIIACLLFSLLFFIGCGEESTTKKEPGEQTTTTAKEKSSQSKKSLTGQKSAKKNQAKTDKKAKKEENALTPKVKKAVVSPAVIVYDETWTTCEPMGMRIARGRLVVLTRRAYNKKRPSLRYAMIPFNKVNYLLPIRYLRSKEFTKGAGNRQKLFLHAFDFKDPNPNYETWKLGKIDRQSLGGRCKCYASRYNVNHLVVDGEIESDDDAKKFGVKLLGECNFTDFRMVCDPATRTFYGFNGGSSVFVKNRQGALCLDKFIVPPESFITTGSGDKATSDLAEKASEKGGGSDQEATPPTPSDYQDWKTLKLSMEAKIIACGFGYLVVVHEDDSLATYNSETVELISETPGQQIIDQFFIYRNFGVCYGQESSKMFFIDLKNGKVLGETKSPLNEDSEVKQSEGKAFLTAKTEWQPPADFAKLLTLRKNLKISPRLPLTLLEGGKIPHWEWLIKSANSPLLFNSAQQAFTLVGAKKGFPLYLTRNDRRVESPLYRQAKTTPDKFALKSLLSSSTSSRQRDPKNEPLFDYHSKRVFKLDESGREVLYQTWNKPELKDADPMRMRIYDLTPWNQTWNCATPIESPKENVIFPAGNRNLTLSDKSLIIKKKVVNPLPVRAMIQNQANWQSIDQLLFPIIPTKVFKRSLPTNFFIGCEDKAIILKDRQGLPIACNGKNLYLWDRKKSLWRIFKNPSPMPCFDVIHRGKVFYALTKNHLYLIDDTSLKINQRFAVAGQALALVKNTAYVFKSSGNVAILNLKDPKASWRQSKLQRRLLVKGVEKAQNITTRVMPIRMIANDFDLPCIPVYDNLNSSVGLIWTDKKNLIIERLTQQVIPGKPRIRHHLSSFVAEKHRIFIGISRFNNYFSHLVYDLKQKKVIKALLLREIGSSPWNFCNLLFRHENSYYWVDSQREGANTRLFRLKDDTLNPEVIFSCEMGLPNAHPLIDDQGRYSLYDLRRALQLNLGELE